MLKLCNFPTHFTSLKRKTFADMIFKDIYFCFLWDFTSRFKLYKRIKIFLENLLFEILVFLISSVPGCVAQVKYEEERRISMRRNLNLTRCRIVFSCFFGILAVGVTQPPTLKYWGRQMDPQIFPCNPALIRSKNRKKRNPNGQL